MLHRCYIHSGSPGNSFHPVHTRSCFSWLALRVALGRAEATTDCTWLGVRVRGRGRVGIGVMARVRVKVRLRV